MAAWPEMVRIMEPTTTREINDVIETLTQVYFERLRDDEQYDLWLAAYTKALKFWPTDVLWAACDEWIANGKPYLKRRTYFNRARAAVAWLRDNPDEHPFVESAETKSMGKRLKAAIADVAKSKEVGDLPSKSTLKEVALGRGFKEADEALEGVADDKQARRDYIAERNKKFLKENRQKPVIFKTKPRKDYTMTDDTKETLKIEGYASLFNIADDVDDVFKPGAFKSSLTDKP